MSVYPAVGTQIQISVSSKFPTFTTDQFRLVLQERGFVMGQGQIPHPQNPQIQVTIATFSKGNTNVAHNPQLNQIAFFIINTLDLNEIYEEIKQILFSLKITSEVILKMAFGCSTRLSTKDNPSDTLTSLMKTSFLEGMRKNLSSELTVSSFRLSSTFPLGISDGCEVVVEPLLTSPENQYFLKFLYQTGNLESFNGFISKFGHSIIQKIIKVVGNNG